MIDGGTKIQAFAKSTEVIAEKMEAALVPDKSSELAPQLESIKKKALGALQSNLNAIIKKEALVTFKDLNEVLSKNK